MILKVIDLLLLPIVIAFLIFLTYALILIFFVQSKEKTYTNNFFPTISIVFPTFNEQYVIRDRIKNLLNTNYPKDKIEIIVSDDSTDNTSEIIKELIKQTPNLKLNRSESRRGYSQSMIDGVQQANGELIIIADAGCYYDENTIPKLVRHFSNSQIGSVSGKAVIVNKSKINAFVEYVYRLIYDRLRTAESNIDSTFHLNGEACCIRSEIAKQITECPANFDIAIGFSTKQSQKRSIVDLQAFFYERAPEKSKERIHQKSVRAEGVIRVLFKYKSMLFNHNYGAFGLIIFPFNFSMLVIAPSLIAISVLLTPIYVLLRFNYPWNLFIIGIVILLLIILFPITLSFMQFLVALIKGLFNALTKKNKKDEVELIESTRIRLDDI